MLLGLKVGTSSDGFFNSDLAGTGAGQETETESTVFEANRKSLSGIERLHPSHCLRASDASWRE